MEDVTIVGAEPFFFPAEKRACFLVHGFTGTTQSMRYPGEHLSKADLTVLAPRLAGDGVRGRPKKGSGLGYAARRR